MNVKRVFLNIIKIFVILLALACTLSILVSFIGNDLVRTNFDISEKRIFNTEVYGWSLYRFSKIGSALDTATDHTMLNECLLPEEFNPFFNAFYNKNYPRYWHGYLIFLKPLLIFFNYEQIRIINMIVFFVLLIVLCCKIKERMNNYFFAIVLIIALSFCYITEIPLCMQYMNTFVNAFITSIIILSIKELDKNFDKVIYIFFICGCLTSFFDFLTTPILTMGLPLFIYLLLMTFVYRKDYKIIVRNMIVLSFVWSSGYLIFWFSKWILSTIVTGINVIEDGINSILFRTSDNNESGNLSRINVCLLQIYEFFHSRANYLKYKYLIFITSIISLIMWKKEIVKLIPFIILTIYPIVWFFVVSGHCGVHFYMTYRILIISVMSTSVFVYVAFTEVIKKIICLKNKG